ncbi:MAG: DUF4388 domain-containing protein [Anaerolineae bacterium]|nr:DUF4388 domain-containing protein [Anaerolineae bacterium]
MALTGDLTDIPIADLIQLHCQAGVRARLIVRHAGQEITVYFDGGEVVHAQFGSVIGEEAVYELLGWETGEFEVEQGVAPPARTVNTPWSLLIMEGMRRLDERRWREKEDRKETMTMETRRSRSEQLEETLRNLVNNSTDIQGAVVISMDGLIIAAVLPPQMEQMRVGAVAAGVLSLSARSVGQLGRGQLQQTLIQGTEGNVIITHAGRNAAFVTLTGKNVNLGMAFLETQEGAQAVANILG